jgi:hypothetical protein
VVQISETEIVVWVGSERTDMDQLKDAMFHIYKR